MRLGRDRAVLDKVFQDATYKSGRFGFYNASQGGVVGTGFQTVEPQGETGYIRLVVLIGLVLLLLVVAAAMVALARRAATVKTRGEPQEEKRE